MPTDRLGTPGLALMILGLFVMYWGFGIFRGETAGPGYGNMPVTPGFGGGEGGDGGGGSGSF